MIQKRSLLSLQKHRPQHLLSRLALHWKIPVPEASPAYLLVRALSVRWYIVSFSFGKFKTKTDSVCGCETSGLQFHYVKDMLKQKNVILVVGTVVVIAALSAGSYLFYGKIHHHNVALGQSFDAMHTDNAAIGSAATQTSSQTPISGNQTTGTNSGPNLSVGASSSANYFGQLGSSTNTSQNGTTSTSNEAQSSNNSGSSSSNSSTNPLNPSTFSQYDVPKYINGTSAYFADLQTGTGTTLSAGHQASVIYKGWLTNGQLFDESQTNSSGQMEPFTFSFGTSPSQVIAGWQEGLAGMKVGGIRLLIIPPAVGYGATGQGPIPGNAVLIFAVQLEAVN